MITVRVSRHRDSLPYSIPTVIRLHFQISMDLQLILQILSCCAIVTTIALFLCGIPICIEIMRRKTTKDISGVPFLMGLLGGSFWLRYGFLKEDSTMIIVNVVAVSLFFIYCLFYMAFSNPRVSFSLFLEKNEYRPNIDYLGLMCMTFNILNFGAPLAGLGVVLRKRCCDTLPLPMCVANLLVSSQWFLYGNIVRDAYIMAPNGIGMALAVLQLSLFVIFPRKENGKSVVSHFADFFIGRRTEDVEKGESAGFIDGKRTRKYSEGAMANADRKAARSLSVPDCSKFKSV
ncbi:unnamed protein product [Nippostrongylus brasiliensis]|uniref:Sugar transporter SWEET n=1 Tax=Nippostrongylus brasiliensis TaxID=27835 RepID=A0A0N4YQH6_NIPBR|nr:unnamed protein product [Nippostrongylus brasiliensis]